MFTTVNCPKNITREKKEENRKEEKEGQEEAELSYIPIVFSKFINPELILQRIAAYKAFLCKPRGTPSSMQ